MASIVPRPRRSLDLSRGISHCRVSHGEDICECSPHVQCAPHSQSVQYRSLCPSEAGPSDVPFQERTPLDFYIRVAPARALLGNVTFLVNFSAPGYTLRTLEIPTKVFGAQGTAPPLSHASPTPLFVVMTYSPSWERLARRHALPA